MLDLRFACLKFQSGEGQGSLLGTTSEGHHCLVMAVASKLAHSPGENIFHALGSAAGHGSLTLPY